MIPQQVVTELHDALKRAEKYHESAGELRGENGAERSRELQTGYLRIIARSLVTLLASMTGTEGTV